MAQERKLKTVETPDDTRDGIYLSINRIAREFGFSNNTVSKRLKISEVSTSAEARGFPVYRLRDVIPAIFPYNFSPETSSVEDPESLSPKEQLDYYRAQRERIKLEEDCGKLIPVDDVSAEIACIVKTVVETLEVLPDTLERDLDIEHEVSAKVEAAIDSLRSMLHERLSEPVLQK